MATKTNAARKRKITATEVQNSLSVSAVKEKLQEKEDAPSGMSQLKLDVPAAKPPEKKSQKTTFEQAFLMALSKKPQDNLELPPEPGSDLSETDEFEVPEDEEREDELTFPDDEEEEELNTQQSAWNLPKSASVFGSVAEDRPSLIPVWSIKELSETYRPPASAEWVQLSGLLFWIPDSQPRGVTDCIRRDLALSGCTRFEQFKVNKELETNKPKVLLIKNAIEHAEKDAKERVFELVYYRELAIDSWRRQFVVDGYRFIHDDLLVVEDSAPAAASAAAAAPAAAPLSTAAPAKPHKLPRVLINKREKERKAQIAK